MKKVMIKLAFFTGSACAAFLFYMLSVKIDEIFYGAIK